jgi:hypothetical protein
MLKKNIFLRIKILHIFLYLCKIDNIEYENRSYYCNGY